MKYTRKDISDTKIQLDVELDKTDLAGVRKLTLTKMAQNLKVPGFRKGKVPPKVAEKHLDPVALEQQLLEDAVNKFVVEAISTEKVQPLDRPHVDIGEFKPGEKLAFTATVEILPKIKLGNYKKLKATREKVAITAKEIDEVIERMGVGMAEKGEVDRSAGDGDEVWIDFSATYDKHAARGEASDFEGTDKEGKAVPGASGKDYPLRLGSSTFIPGFEEGLVGKKKGQTFELPLTFPNDYHHKPLAGAEVTFKITVNKVNAVVPPKIDDAFAAKIGPFKTVAEMRDDIKRELTARKEQDALNALKDNLVEQLVKVSHVPAPDVLLEDQINSLERDTIQNLSYRGVTIDQFLAEQNLTRDQWRQGELKEAAMRRVQIGLALAELSKAEDIQVTKADLDNRHDEMLSQYTDPHIRSQFDTPEARRDLANRVLTEKTVDRLVELNT